MYFKRKDKYYFESENRERYRIAINYNKDKKTFGVFHRKKLIGITTNLEKAVNIAETHLFLNQESTHGQKDTEAETKQ